MADEEQLKILAQGVEAWNKWRKGNPGIEPNLEGANLSGAGLQGVNLVGSDLSRTNLEGADLQRADLRGLNFPRTILYGANLGGCDLREANLSGAYVDDATRLNRANVRSCEISRYVLECLNSYGGLTKGALTKMIIHDDLADLRATFSGIRLWLHLFALAAFLFPYLSFVAVRYFEARFVTQSDKFLIPLWEAIARYIWNGGQHWQDGWHFHWSFAAFVALSLYNVCRWLLLSKTIQLEHLQEIRGLPSSFRLEQEPFWNVLVRSMSFLFWVGLAVLALNTAHFLTQQVPISPN